MIIKKDASALLFSKTETICLCKKQFCCSSRYRSSVQPAKCQEANYKVVPEVSLF